MKRSGYWWLLTAVTAGEMAGSCLRLLYPRADLWENMLFLHGVGICGGDLAHILCRLVLYPLLWLLLYWGIGVTVFALPGIYLLLFLHGMALGGELAVLYRGQVLTGLAAAVFFVMPYALIQTGLWLLSAREALRAPSLKRHSAGRGEAGKGQFRTYTLRFAGLAAAAVLFSGLQGLWMGSIYPAVLHRLAGNQ